MTLDNLPSQKSQDATQAASDAAAKGVRDTAETWERTQQLIALAVTGSVLLVAATKTVYDMFFNGPSTGPAFIFLVGAANLVIGFYFGRTKSNGNGSS